MKLELLLQYFCIIKAVVMVAVAVSRLVLLLMTLLVTTSSAGGATTIHLLTLLPSGGQNSTADWDKGQEHLPGADLALKIINQRSDILPGYQLELIYANTDTCTETLPMGSLVDFYRHAIDDPDLNRTIVGVVGVLCPPVVKFISPVADRDDIDLVQVSAGPGSPPFKESTDGYSRLYRVISSSGVYNKALVALMNEFNWRRISIVRDSVNIYYTGTTDDFAEVINGSDISVTFQGAISPTFITPTLDNVKLTESRILYASVTEDEAANLMCQAYHNNLLWPGYVWLFHDRTIQDFTSRDTGCSRDVMIKAIEGVFFIRFRLETPDPNMVMVSGQNFAQFQEELNNGAQWRNNSYAFALHDAVWSFALALNKTLDSGNSLSSYYLGNNDYSEMLARALNEISFHGALGYIDFDEDEREATTTIVDIFQVNQGEENRIGYYNSSTDSITFENRPSDSEIPDDEFGEEYDRLSLGLRVTAIIIAVIFIVVTTGIFVLFIYYRNIEEIRATSLPLSLLIFTGCYLLYIAAIVLASREFAADDPTAFSALCNIEVWLATIGLEMIFSVLFVRLLRVYRIFFDYNKVGKLWTDQSLFVMALLVVLGSVVLLVIWVAVDPLKQVRDREYHSDTNPPFYEVVQHCSSDNIIVWLILLLVYSVLLIVVVLVLAIKTRKVKLESFKDTKKVNAYIFITVAMLGLCMPLAVIFTVTQVQIAAHIFQSSAFIITGALCQVFLFAPKLWSGVLEVKLISERSRKSSNNGNSGPSGITQPTAIPPHQQSFPEPSSP